MEKSLLRRAVDAVLDHNLYRLVVLVMVVVRTCAFLNPVIGPFVKFTLAWSALILIKDLFTERLFMVNRFRGALYLFLIAYGVTCLVNREQNLARNLVMAPYRPIGVSHWGAEVDYNVFADSTALQVARKNGTDLHSIVYSVQFKAPAEGDFTLLHPVEAAVACGFRNFPMDRFGVVSPRLKRMARQPSMPIPVVQGGAGQTDVWDWQGLRLKSLDTLEERSATGMDSERGVYVVAVQAMKNPFRDQVRPNDVILKLGSKNIRTLSDWKKAVEEADWSRPQTLTLFREQKTVEEELPGGIIF